MNRIERQIRRIGNRRHVQSAHVLGGQAAPARTSIVTAVRRTSRALAAGARRWLLNRRLDHINNQIAHIQAFRLDSDLAELHAFERQALIRAALRASVPGAALDHETEHMVG